MRLAELERVETTVGLRELLLDDVRLDGDAQVVRLPGQVGRGVVVGPAHFEIGVPQVAPEHGEHPQLVGVLEHLRHLDELPL